jgi:hypothetical protein
MKLSQAILYAILATTAALAAPFPSPTNPAPEPSPHPAGPRPGVLSHEIGHILGVQDEYKDTAGRLKSKHK